jgi:hypothetical protein
MLYAGFWSPTGAVIGLAAFAILITLADYARGRPNADPEAVER